MKRTLLAFCLMGPLLCGCMSVASGVADVAQSLSASTPAQATSLAEALQAATLVNNAADIYVTSGNPDRVTLIEMRSLATGVHTALGDLQAANARGQSLTYASFNAALDGFNNYATAKGIAH